MTKPRPTITQPKRELSTQQLATVQGGTTLKTYPDKAREVNAVFGG